MILKRNILAIDPGKDGAIVTLDPETLNVLEKFPFPMIGTKPDLKETAMLLDAFHVDNYFVYLEEVHAIFGASAKSTFEFGAHFGFLLGVLNQKGFKYDLVAPKIWQKKVWTTRDKVLKAGGRADPKPTSLLACKRLFPEVDFTPTERSKKFHEGMVDAALIAYYGALTLKNN